MEGEWGGARSGAGRHKLPTSKKKLKVIVYVSPAVKAMIDKKGGSKWLRELITRSQ